MMLAGLYRTSTLRGTAAAAAVAGGGRTARSSSSLSATAAASSCLVGSQHNGGARWVSPSSGTTTTTPQQQQQRQQRANNLRAAAPFFSRGMASAAPAAVTPAPLLKICGDHWVSRTFLTAIEFDLYSLLAASPGGGMTGPQIKEALSLCEEIRRTHDFLDTLVSVGMLDRDGNGPSGVYKNTPVTGFFLDKAKGTYVGEDLERASLEMYPSLIGYTEALKDPTTTHDPYDAVDECLESVGGECAIIDPPDLDEGPMLDVAFSFARSRTLLTAAEVEFHTAVVAGGNKVTADQVAESLGLSKALTPAFAQRLVEIDTLTVEGEGDDALYSCTPIAEHFLDKEKLTYMGGAMNMFGRRLYGFWADLPEALRTGKAQNEEKTGGKLLFEAVYETPEGIEEFATAMSGLSTAHFRSFANHFDFSNYKTHLDVGGSTGIMACAVADANPHMECTSADLPAVVPVAEKWIKKRGCDDRVKAIPIDFFEDKGFPNADVISMGLILHDWNLETKKMLIQKAYDALPEGGALVTIDVIIDDERRERTDGLTMSLNMLIETGSVGFDFSHAEFHDWCIEIGFNRTEPMLLPETGNVACVAYK